MEPFIDYYSLLQVHCDAEQDIIDATYRKLCKKYHPDICKLPDAEKRMKDINLAYEVLGDESRRQAYTSQYKRRTDGWFTGINAPKKSAEPARQAISGYMLAISSELYHDAYEFLSDIDKKHITLDKFVQWQRLVSAVYHVEGFELKASRSFDSFCAEEDTSLRAVRFDVEVTERNKLSGTVRRYIMKKFAVEQNGRWRAYLGYKDLTEIMNEFQYLVQCQQDPQMLSDWRSHRASVDSATGLLNRAAFLDQSGSEVYRYERYKQSFTVAVLQVKPQGYGADYAAFGKAAARAAHCIKNALRKGDLAGCVGRGRFAMIMLRMDERHCKRVLTRISERIRRDCMAALDIQVEIATAFRAYGGGKLEYTLEQCERSLR